MPIRSSRPLTVFKWLMYLVITLQFIRVYGYSTTFYLRLPAYLSGHERLPFQMRLLPVFFYDLFYKSPWMMKHIMTHVSGAFSPQNGPLFWLSLLSLSACCYFITKLYNAVSLTRSLGVLVYPFFLVTVMLTYSNHVEQNFSYPYDFAAIAFFTAGLYFIYTRQFVPLLLVMILGTLNRETTLFLIGIYALDAATVAGTDANGSMERLPIWKRLSLGQILWLRLILLSAVWIGIKLALGYAFRNNDHSEDYSRLSENLHRLSPRLLPAMLNLCGYLLPVVWVLRRYVRPTRLGNYIYIVPFWLVVMFKTGIIVEVRIYGELCSYAALACVLLLEQTCRAEQTPLENVPLST